MWRMTVLLEATALTKRYGSVWAPDSVDFQVSDGITGLLGPNGAGKSTAIKLSLGLIRPTSGSVEVMGRRPYYSPEVRERLGYMPEHDCLPRRPAGPSFSPTWPRCPACPPAEARTRAADILRHVGLEEERYRPIGQYSTGMKQRVKLGQALVHDPSLVLLDEPTAGLDPTGREEMLRLVRRTGREFGISIILSSHLINDVESTCGRIIVLEGGTVTEEGTVAGFTADTQVIVLELGDKREDVATALAARGISVAQEGHSLTVELQCEDQYDDIRDAVAESGGWLRRVSPRRRQLAEIFRADK